jgi:hypothetical protein
MAASSTASVLSWFLGCSSPLHGRWRLGPCSHAGWCGCLVLGILVASHALVVGKPLGAGLSSSGDENRTPPGCLLPAHGWLMLQGWNETRVDGVLRAWKEPPCCSPASEKLPWWYGAIDSLSSWVGSDSQWPLLPSPLWQSASLWWCSTNGEWLRHVHGGVQLGGGSRCHYRSWQSGSGWRQWRIVYQCQMGRVWWFHHTTNQSSYL